MKRQIVLVVHDVRSCHNVGSLLRTADGLGIEQVFLTGYTPYPAGKNDTRLPHIAAKMDKSISKTALGAEKSVKWEHQSDIARVINKLKAAGYKMVALEQTPTAVDLSKFKPTQKIAVLVGSEVEGLSPDVLNMVDAAVQIPMLGAKESFNVASATAIALYKLRFS